MEGFKCSASQSLETQCLSGTASKDSSHFGSLSDTAMLSCRPSSYRAAAATESVLSSMSTRPSAEFGYVDSSTAALISTDRPVRPEASMKQQLTATKSLPVGVLVNLFQHLEPKQVHTLALVCSSWRTAAAAATCSISVQFTNSNRLDLNTSRKAKSLRQWIRNNGAGLKQLSLVCHCDWEETLAVPLAELRQLQVLTIQSLGIAQWDGRLSQALADLDGLSLLTSLTKLRLDDYPVMGSFNVLSALTRLQELYLVPAPYEADPNISCKGKISELALQQLTQLTSLSIKPTTVEHSAMSATSATGILSKLSKLQKLEYIDSCFRHGSQLAGLPGRLTHFRAAWGGRFLLTKALAPDLAKLTALQHLELSGQVDWGLTRSYVSPCVIQDMTQLTHLALSGVYRDASELLLSVVGGLQELRHLQFSGMGAVDMPLAQQDPRQFSSLTASSHLTHLDLLFTPERFPNNVGGYIFPEDRQLPDLKVLKLGQKTVTYDSFYLSILDPRVLDRIVQNCPAIERLSFCHAVDVSIDESVIAQLSCLTQLAIDGAVLRDSTIKGMLPRLAKLRDLTLWDTNMTDVGALEMTQLTGLTRLVMTNADPNGGFMERGVCLECSEKQPNPVWQQLQTACRQSAKCAGILLERAEAALAESQRREQDLTYQLTATRQQLSAVQQQPLQEEQAGPLAAQQRQLTGVAAVAVGTQTE